MGLVCFAFGVAAGPSGGALPGPLLVRLLADLGLSESAARSLLLRMRREGWVLSSRRGRLAHYSLAPIITLTQERIERQLRGIRPQWGGAFSALLYSIPERDRAFRDRLRRAAHLVGYATLRPGLLLASSDHSEALAPILDERPPGSQLLRARLELSERDSLLVASELWQLAPLAVRYRSVIGSAVAATSEAERRAPSGRDAFTAFAAATLPIYEVSAADPDLPAELLPEDWPGPELAVTLGNALRVFAPLVGGYVEQLRATAPAEGSR